MAKRKPINLGLFKDNEEAREYAEDYGFDQVEALILEDMGESRKAASLHFREGRYSDGLEILLTGVPGAILQEDLRTDCENYLIEGLWRFFPIGIDLSHGVPTEARSLLQLTERVMKVCSLTRHNHALVNRPPFD